MRKSGLLVLLTLWLVPAPAESQDGNIMMPVDSIEMLLAESDFEVINRVPSRGKEGERTDQVTLAYPDGSILQAKWATAPRGGEEFNNEPRFELAAYELQKLFLGESEYVVPPTVIRAFSIPEYQVHDPEAYARATLRDTEAILVVLQYWLFNVTSDDFWDEDRFESDTTYARHFANFNIATYLMRHSDENEGNFLISVMPENPRVFSVDNGVAFSSPESDRGFRWRRLRVDRVPAATVERLRALTAEELEARLGTLAEFRILPDGTLERTDPSASVDTGDGVRTTDDRVQLGLTRREIGEVWGRIQHLLGEVDDGDLEVF